MPRPPPYPPSKKNEPGFPLKRGNPGETEMRPERGKNGKTAPDVNAGSSQSSGVFSISAASASTSMSVSASETGG